MANKQKTLSGNTTVFRPEWADSSDIQRWLREEMFVGRTLNFPCGKSLLGDVRADKDPAVAPDLIADIENPPFGRGEFETVYCDPPYSFHAYDRNQWVLELWNIASKRLILQTKNQRYNFPTADRTVYLAERPRDAMAYQIFQVFDRENTALSTFLESPSEE